MPRQRDWVDYAHLVSSVAQNFQLRGLSQTVSALEALAQDKAGKEERIDRFKSALFAIEDQLERVSQSDQLNLRQRLYALHSTQAVVEQLRSSAEMSFEGMDRWRAVKAKVETSLKAAEHASAPDEVAKVRQAFQWAASLNVLEASIYRNVRQEEIAELRRTEQLFRETQRQRNYAGWLYTAVGIFAAGWISAIITDKVFIGQTATIAAGIVGFLWWVRVSIASTGACPKADKLLARIQELEGEDDLWDELMPDLRNRLAPELKGLTAEKLHQIYCERMTFVNQTMGTTLEPLSIQAICERQNAY